MTDRTTQYADLVLSGARLAGRKEMLAMQRFKEDVERSKQKDFPYVFDTRRAEEHIGIANMLTISEGTEAKRLKTRGFQDFIIGNLHGWVHKETGERRFREAYIQLGRQNGKSFLSGVTITDFANFSGYKLGRIYCAATKQDQANIVWDEVAKFIRADKDLAELHDIREYSRTIKSLATGTVIKSLGRDTKSVDGFRSILSVIDEYHAHPTNQMYKLLMDGQINVDGALTLAITTAGFNLQGPCYEQYKFCEKVLEGTVRKDSLFIYITEMDPDDDIWDPHSWAKANPLILWKDDTTMDKAMLARMAEKAIEAKEKGGADLVNFETKSLNTWVTYTGGSLIDLAAWKRCESERTLQHMKGREAYLGIDLSSGGDLTSIALLFPIEDKKFYIWSKSYMPELRLAEHQQTDDVPYGEWTKAGLMTLTSGMYGIKTDYQEIIKDLRQIIEGHNINIVGCGYDPHNASAFLSDLEQVLSCDLTEVKQSARSLSEVTEDFQLSVKAGLVEYDKDNALMSWSVSNAIVSAPNSFGEIKVDKMTQTDRIDVVDAILDAWKVWFINKGQEQLSGEDALDAWLGITKEAAKK